MRIVIGAVVLLVIAFIALSWRPAIAPIATPAQHSFAPEQVALGARLAAAGNCAACHSVAGGPAYGGGLGVPTDFGVIYSTNISPDEKTGIGRWSAAAFARAMREGVSRDGTHLFPAFPYTHYTRLTDVDVQALYAFFMTRPAVDAPARANGLRFPFDLRGLQAGWKLLFFDRGVYEDVAGRSAEWNRGAYLADGLAHCAACHTPRNRFGAERGDAAYAGAPYDGWLAPPLDASNPAPVAWSEQDLYDYLRHGESELHGVAAGAMSGVVHDGLAQLPDTDIRALAVYFAALNGSANKAGERDAALAKAESRRLADVGRETEPGANLYLAACAACHYAPASQPPAVHGSLALSSALTARDPANFIQTVMQGVGGAGVPGPYMPGLAAALTDADIALLAEYLRRTRSDQPAWTDLPAAIAARRPVTARNP